MQQGRGKEYHGIAVHPRHLSLFEKGVLGIHHQYNPELDAEAKKAEASQKVSQRLQVCCSHVHKHTFSISFNTLQSGVWSQL